MVAFVPQEEMAPPPAEPTALRDYTFDVMCNSGQRKTFNFQAADFLAARTKLAELIAEN